MTKCSAHAHGRMPARRSSPRGKSYVQKGNFCKYSDSSCRSPAQLLCHTTKWSLRGVGNTHSQSATRLTARTYLRHCRAQPSPHRLAIQDTYPILYHRSMQVFGRPLPPPLRPARYRQWNRQFHRRRRHTLTACPRTRLPIPSGRTLLPPLQCHTFSQMTSTTSLRRAYRHTRSRRRTFSQMGRISVQSTRRSLHCLRNCTEI